jgi:hypothetical protein
MQYVSAMGPHGVARVFVVVQRGSSAPRVIRPFFWSVGAQARPCSVFLAFVYQDAQARSTTFALGLGVA